MERERLLGKAPAGLCSAPHIKRGGGALGHRGEAPQRSPQTPPFSMFSISLLGAEATMQGLCDRISCVRRAGRFAWGMRDTPADCVRKT